MASTGTGESAGTFVQAGTADVSSGGAGLPSQAEPVPPRRRSHTVLMVAALAAVLVVAGGATVLLRGSAGPHTVDADRVSELDHTLRTALVTGDVHMVDKVLAPRFELIDPSGDRQARDDYLDSVSSGDLDYEAFDPITPVAVRVSGDVAVVTYESQLEVSAGDLHLRHRAWHTHVYEQTGGRWLQVWSQATAVGGFPPSGG